MDMTVNELKNLTFCCWGEKNQPLTIDMTKEIYWMLSFRIKLCSFQIQILF